MKKSPVGVDIIKLFLKLIREPGRRDKYFRSIPPPSIPPAWRRCGRILLATAILGSLACAKSPNPDDYRITPAASPPDWALLDPYQFTMTRDEFQDALSRIYSEGGAYKTTIKIHPGHAEITRSMKYPDGAPYRLNFAASTAERKSPQREKPFWRAADDLPVLASPAKPLSGLHIGIDPGHIGGTWSKMEARWFQIGDKPPVEEGTLTLRVANILKPRLEALGAKVDLVRRNLEPVTKTRPDDFAPLAKQLLELQGVAEPAISYRGLPPDSSKKHFTVQWQSELLFYRAQEIRDRARVVNDKIRPDLVLCLHFNAEDWGNPERPSFVRDNHFHLLCNGNYSSGEFGLDDVRFEMLRRLLQRVHEEEIPLCDAVASGVAKRTGLPAYVYPRSNARRINDNHYLFARNLLANRAYLCPVVFLEPYVMNHRDVFDRVQNAATESPNIFDEYADGVVQGLVDYYREQRGTKENAEGDAGEE